jgi:predicted PurR-regulated permease PerM
VTSPRTEPEAGGERKALRSPAPAATSYRRPLFGLLAVTLAALCLWVLAPFIASIAWAVILAYVSWPAFRRLRKLFGRSRTAAALAMIVLVTCVLVAPLLWLLVLLRDEWLLSFKPLAASLSQEAHLIAQGMQRIPWLGTLLQSEFNRYLADPSALVHESMQALQSWLLSILSLLGGLGRDLAKMLLTLLLLFFCYRDGETIATELTRAAKSLFGGRHIRYLRSAGAITRAIFFGVMLSAAAQGLIAGIGYRLAGLNAPVLLGALTAVLSVIPLVGTALVWLPLAIGLAVTGAWGKGLMLLAWGLLLVHPTDNLLRPLLASNAAKLPFLPVALGAIGGMAAFGLIGAFAGPILLGIALELWRQSTAATARLPPADPS